MTAPLIVLGLPDAWAMYRHAGPEIRELTLGLVGRIQERIGDEVEHAAAMTYEQRRDHTREHILGLAERGDQVMFTDDGDDVFGVLVRVLAVLALQPGGVVFAAHLWCHRDALEEQ